jgi:hypothetical protein
MGPAGPSPAKLHYLPKSHGRHVPAGRISSAARTETFTVSESSGTWTWAMAPAIRVTVPRHHRSRTRTSTSQPTFQPLGRGFRSVTRSLPFHREGAGSDPGRQEAAAIRDRAGLTSRPSDWPWRHSHGLRAGGTPPFLPATVTPNHAFYPCPESP